MPFVLCESVRPPAHQEKRRRKRVRPKVLVKGEAKQTHSTFD